jgi:hypothetical protein
VVFRSSSKPRPVSISNRPGQFPSTFFEVYGSPIILPTTIYNSGKIVELQKKSQKKYLRFWIWDKNKKPLKTKELFRN